jgi:hypothetical protein
MSEQPEEYLDAERPAEVGEQPDPEAPADAPPAAVPDEEREESPAPGADAIGADEGLVDTRVDPRTTPYDAEEERLAEENAATSLDQPSENVE